MANLTLRAAEPGDIPAILEIWNAAIRDTTVTFTTQPKTRAELAERLRAPFPFLVADHAGGIAGFATCGAFRSGPGYAHTFEHSIYLRPDQQAQGTGRALMGALERDAAAAGAHSLIGALSGTNEAALRFHQALGYDTVAHIPQAGRKNDQWLDLLLVQKILHFPA